MRDHKGSEKDMFVCPLALGYYLLRLGPRDVQESNEESGHCNRELGIENDLGSKAHEL